MTSFFRFGLVAAAAGLGAVIAWPIGVLPPPLTELEGDVNRGAYLARASGCIACHSDFRSGGAPLAGGVQLETPFGAIYSPNLTTDAQTEQHFDGQACLYGRIAVGLLTSSMAGRLRLPRHLSIKPDR